MTFYRWLTRQVERDDDVGVFARLVAKDKIFPRADSARLHLFLLRYERMPEERQMLKRAHREWRKQQRTEQAA